MERVWLLWPSPAPPAPQSGPSAKVSWFVGALRVPRGGRALRAAADGSCPRVLRELLPGPLAEGGGASGSVWMSTRGHEPSDLPGVVGLGCGMACQLTHTLGADACDVYTQMDKKPSERLVLQLCARALSPNQE